MQVDQPIFSTNRYKPGCHLLGEEDGNDTYDPCRSRNNIKSFDSAYRTKNVGNGRRRFYLRALRVCYFEKLRSFDGQGKSCLSMRVL
jgi:hypothetical protein